jgi:hypothetical protein
MPSPRWIRSDAPERAGCPDEHVHGPYLDHLVLRFLDRLAFSLSTMAAGIASANPVANPAMCASHAT